MSVKVWKYILLLGVLSKTLRSQTCPSDHFSAVFVATADQVFDDPNIFDAGDPELDFFKNVLKLREEEIPYVFEEAIKFFNSTFGLDFSAYNSSQPNVRVFENAVMSAYRSPDSVKYYVTANNWIRNGNTRSTCYRIYEGGIRVFFSAEQILYGSYGGAEGKPAGITTQLAYGYYSIDTCKQSPVIIQYQTSTPFRAEPVDGIFINNSDLYNRVLGQGKAEGIGFIIPDPENPGKFRLTIRNVLSFPALN